MSAAACQATKAWTPDGRELRRRGPRAELLAPADHKRLKDLLRHQTLPAVIHEALLRSLHDLAAELEAVTLDRDAFAATLLVERSVLTVDELE